MNDIPEKSLAKIFDYENQGEELINNFCEKIEKRLGWIEPNLEQEEDEEDEEFAKRKEVRQREKKTIHLISSVFISKFLYWKYTGFEQEFLNDLTSTIISIILEIKQKQHIWNKWFKDTEITTILEDEQEQVAGKITSKGKRDISELGSFGRILNNFDKIAWRLDNYFPRFYPLFSRHISFREAFR